jgi:hypothetical protein
MNRPVFPRIPESRRRAQERAAARAHIPAADAPAVGLTPQSDADGSEVRAQVVTDTPRPPGAPDSGAVR